MVSSGRDSATQKTSCVRCRLTVCRRHTCERFSASVGLFLRQKEQYRVHLYPTLIIYESGVLVLEFRSISPEYPAHLSTSSFLTLSICSKSLSKRWRHLPGLVNLATQAYEAFHPWPVDSVPRRTRVASTATRGKGPGTYPAPPFWAIPVRTCSNELNEGQETQGISENSCTNDLPYDRLRDQSAAL